MFDEFGRLSEMQRRNTQCLPHMKTSYPVETQVTSPHTMDEMRIKRGTPIAVEHQHQQQQQQQPHQQLLHPPQPRIPLAHSTKTITLDDAHTLPARTRRGQKRAPTVSPDDVTGAHTVAAATSPTQDDVRKVS